MRNTISFIVVISLFSLTWAPAVFADSSSEENIGVGSGAVIGAIAGGPVGFIIGAALGAKFGDTVYEKNESIEDLSASLDDSRQDLRHLNASYDSVSTELEHMQQVARPELVSMLEAGIAMDLLFRTDEHALADSTGDAPD